MTQSRFHNDEKTSCRLRSDVKMKLEKAFKVCVAMERELNKRILLQKMNVNQILRNFHFEFDFFEVRCLRRWQFFIFFLVEKLISFTLIWSLDVFDNHVNFVYECWLKTFQLWCLKTSLETKSQYCWMNCSTKRIRVILRR